MDTPRPLTGTHGLEAASTWVQRWSHLVPAGATLLDVACGGGRHVRWFAARGCRVTGVDRDAAAVEPLRGIAEIEVADIEHGPWPWRGRMFDAVVVINYLWRPLLPTLVASVAPGGMFIYETFVQGNETVGRPSNPDFLLRPGELLDTVRPAMRVVAYEDGFLDAPAHFVQRVVAVREREGSDPARPARPPRYPLSNPSFAGSLGG
jgi:SAM-dependent methyltransferase